MNRKNLFSKAKILAIFAFILLALPNLSQAGRPAQAEVEQPSFGQTASVEPKPLSLRALILQEYLAAKGSPMQYSAQDFIDAADKYQVDWKLVPAIAGVESTFGKYLPGGANPATSSFNAYGWGVYGNQAIYFDSWKDGIYTLNQLLKEKYINKGLKTPRQMNRIYAASPTWGSKVSFFMGDIDQFAKVYEKNLDSSRLKSVLDLLPSPGTAPAPGVIAFK